MTVKIIVGDCRDVLRRMDSESVHCVVSSPPYWGLRDYGVQPSAWGGDADCPHEWGDELLDRSRRSPGTQNGSLTGDGRYQAEACRFEIRSNFCVRCGAWRGVFGLEPSYRLYVEHAVEIFREVRRVLRRDGTLWLNLGDSYATGAGAVGDHPGGGEQGSRWAGRPAPGATAWAGVGVDRHGGAQGSRGGSKKQAQNSAVVGPMTQPNRMPQPGLKPKDLCGIPWRVALALQDDGWWLRQDIIWSKPNPMPESIKDRCTKAHEYLFLLAKSEHYYFDAEAIAEPASYDPEKTKFPDGWDTGEGGHGSFHRNGREKGRASGNKTHKGVSEYERSDSEEHRTKAGLLKISDTAFATRNKRSVWNVATQPFPEAHFATFPPALIEPCIAAGTSEHGCCASCGAPWARETERIDKGYDGSKYGERAIAVGWHPTCACAPQTENGKLARAVVLDPFGGAGTTGLVADRLKRDAVLIELNPEYADMARRRIKGDGGMFSSVSLETPTAAAAE